MAYLQGEGGRGGRGADCPPLTSDKQQKKREKEKEKKEKGGKRREIFCFVFVFGFCLSARILSKIRCGNNVARHKVCEVKITAILIEMH